MGIATRLDRTGTGLVQGCILAIITICYEINGRTDGLLLTRVEIWEKEGTETECRLREVIALPECDLCDLSFTPLWAPPLH